MSAIKTSAIKISAITVCYLAILLGCGIASADCEVGCDWVDWERAYAQCKNYFFEQGRAMVVVNANDPGTRCYPDTFVEYWTDCECDALGTPAFYSEASVGNCAEEHMGMQVYCDCYSGTGA